MLNWFNELYLICWIKQENQVVMCEYKDWLRSNYEIVNISLIELSLRCPSYSTSIMTTNFFNP